MREKNYAFRLFPRAHDHEKSKSKLVFPLSLTRKLLCCIFHSLTPHAFLSGTMKRKNQSWKEENKKGRKAKKKNVKSNVGIWVLRARVYPASVTSP
jgi:hypothetical protein